MLIPLSSLRPGDVLLIKYSDTYWHTMLVVNNGRIAHAPGPGNPCVMQTMTSFADETKREQKLDDEGLLRQLYAYRYTEQPPYPDWIAFAEQWCVRDVNDRITPYAPIPNEQQRQDPNWKNYPRYRGVFKGDDDGHNSLALPFGVDALWRTIKWAKRYRYKEAFSINRGTTCCAFIMACIQTSFVNAAFLPNVDGNQKLSKMVNLFDSNVRGVRRHEKGQPHEGGALRDHSNRGLSQKLQDWAEGKTDPQQVAGLWKSFWTNGFVLYDWKTVGLPDAVKRDAKYVYSRTFNHLLSTANDWAAL